MKLWGSYSNPSTSWVTFQEKPHNSCPPPTLAISYSIDHNGCSFIFCLYLNIISNNFIYVYDWHGMTLSFVALASRQIPGQSHPRSVTYYCLTAFHYALSIRKINNTVLFLELFKKNWILSIYIHISKGSNSLKIVHMTKLFFRLVQEIKIKFTLSLNPITSKNHDAKM